MRELLGKLVLDTLMGQTLGVNRGVITASVRRYRLDLE